MVSRRMSERTHEFHQTILRLAHEFSAEELAWDVSQEILDKVWEQASNKEDNPIEAASSNGGDSTTISRSCQACGFQIHPGWRGTTLRVKRRRPIESLARKRTLKRRALRQKKKALLEQQQSAKDRPRHNRRKNSASNTSNASRLYLLSDDSTVGPLDRNLLVLTCGRCGDKTCLKGLKREPPLQRKKQPSVLGASKPMASGGVDNLSGNFEQLPKLAATKTPPVAQSLRGAPAKSRTSLPTKTLLEQKLTKKSKKKKKPTAKKSGNLMDFLSSLNDH